MAKKIQEYAKSVSLHEAAMHEANLADAVMRAGKAESQNKHLKMAADLEREAAACVDESVQPTHAILCRSAASLFFQLGDNDNATAMAKMGLLGVPPTDVASELRAMLRSLTKEPWPDPVVDVNDEPKPKAKREKKKGS